MSIPNSPLAFPEERRMATILFVELGGSTALSGSTDLEVFADLIKRAWKELDRVIAEHGGRIDHRTGSRVSVVWGAPVAGEDDAFKAVNCALALQSALAGLPEDAYPEGTAALQLQAGVASGPVLATYVGLEPRYTVIGEAVGISRLLVESAYPEGVLIAHSTYRLVRGVFRVHRREPLEVRGSSQPVQVYDVERALEQPTRVRYTSEGGLESRMVGRDEALADLLDLFEALSAAADPYLGLVIGETGMGKSRLLMEFAIRVEASEPDVQFVSVRGLFEARRAPFHLWKSLWKQRFDIPENMDPEKAKEVFLRGILRIWGKRLGPYSAVEAAHLVGDLIGMNWKNSPYLSKYENNPEARNARAFELTRELLVRMAEAGPIVFVVDDLQWVDPCSLDMLRMLLEQGTDALPVFFLAGVRPDFFENRFTWLNAAYRSVRLGPIEFTVPLIRQAYPAVESFPDALLARMAERSGGNPYFLEEIVKSIVLGGGETLSGPVAAPSIAHPIPDNLRGLLQSRIDVLPREAREVLQLAAISGRIFWAGAIKASARQPVGTGLLNLPEEVLDRVVQNALRQIVRAELAFSRTGSMFEGEQEYIFKHQLLQEVAYDTLPEKYRKFYHFAVARWLSERAGPDLNVMIAGHYERAGNISTALRYYQFALNYAQANGARADAGKLETHIRDMRSGEIAASGG